MSVPSSSPNPATAYDLVEYPSQVHAQTHPERLATIGTLFGLKPAPPANCRVLELGCGDGGNLIAMAWALPESRFTGLDLAARPLEHGRELAGHLGLKNLDLLHRDLLAVDRSLGEFDYIIAHGVYAWVPAEVRDHLLSVCRQCLAPQGIAFVSYNSFPGSHLSIMLREMMLAHAGRIADPAEKSRQSLALMNLIAGARLATDHPANDWIRFGLL
jgi:SAM-dependent methyltransferase